MVLNRYLVTLLFIEQQNFDINYRFICALSNQKDTIYSPKINGIGTAIVSEKLRAEQ